MTIKSMLLLVILTIAGALIAAITNQTKILAKEQWRGYEAEWNTTDSLEAIGLPQSALEQVSLIYDYAKKDKNDAQLIKALIYKAKYINQVEEDAQVKAINLFADEVASADGVTKSMLQSILAEIYWNYYQNHRWEFSNRTTTVNFENNDIRTWSLSALHEKTAELYIASVANREALKQVKISRYYDILYKGDNYSQLLRPTLFDFLAHRALDFLVNDAAYITDAAYNFSMSNPIVFGSNKAFVGFVFDNQNTDTRKLFALHLLQDLTNAHLYDPYPDALIDVDIKRLDFAKNNYSGNDKDSLYLNALYAEEKLYLRDSSSTRVTYLIAQHYYNLGTKFNAETAINYKWDFKTALEISNAAIARFPESIGAKNCIALNKSIEQREFTIITEGVNTPENPFRAAVNFRNIDTLYLRIIAASPEIFDQMDVAGYDEKFTALNEFPVVKAWSQKMPNDGDFQTHLTEIKIDGLPLGFYYLIGSVSPSFNLSDNKLIAQEICISNLSYMFTNSNYYNNSSKLFYVLDRTTGKPIKGASVETFRKEYDYNKRVYKYNSLKTLLTDENGSFEVNDPLIKDYYYFTFKIKYGNDVIVADDNYYISKEVKPNKNNSTVTYFFTDRSIYRPGQTIYFKGIMVESEFDKKNQHVAVNKKSTVGFYDVNGQLVADVAVTTNDYGSFSGSFTAPSGVLTGTMHIQNETGSAYFSVEAYKRPTFSVSTNPVEGDFVLGDSVSVSGSAISYAGANIDNATISYRVVRNTYFPYYKYGYDNWRNPYPTVNAVEITNGELATDDAGKFIITFKAESDAGINESLLPMFSYSVLIDVTDKSGETRSTQASISVGYVSTNIVANFPETITTGLNNKINISTTNLNGTIVKASGTIDIIELASPNKLYRKRTWGKPDVHIMDEATYHKLFPNDLYADENNKYTWAEGNNVLSTTWKTDSTNQFELNTKTLKQGEYKMLITALDKSGKKLEIIKYFSVLHQGNYAVAPEYIFSSPQSKGYQPGESAIINIGSSAKNVSALLTVTKNDGSTATKWINLPENVNKFSNAVSMDIEMPISEADRGGFSAQICFIKDGRFFNRQYYIDVPWTNKKLTINLATHRDKLQPGANETWNITISGNGGEKVASELLANMYDASLDAFKGHSWMNISWPGFYNYRNWSASTFENSRGFNYTDNTWWQHGNYYGASYNSLNWFGLYWGNSYYFADALYDSDMGEEDMQIKTIQGVTREDVAKSPSKKQKEYAMNEDEGNVNIISTAKELTKSNALGAVSTRTNLNETAFFYPHLLTDAEGNISISFTMPEALTKWNFMAFAHTRDMQSAQIFDQVVTQKELMIQPHAPRFLREGDDIVFTAKVSNLTDSTINGLASLELFDALTMQPVDAAFKNDKATVSFNAGSKGSAAVSWKLHIPSGYDAIVYKVKAASGTFSDGEENALPVLSNRILVTEALPLWVRGNKTASFTFDKLLASNKSSSIRNQSLTLEYTSNPAWYAMQALPYMMEYPYECAEQVFSRYYSNSIAAHIANADEDIRRVFDSWKNNPSSLTSNLEKNQELKQLMLEETPWVLQAQNETERKKRVALLFDINRMNNETEAALNKLADMQLPNGGWPWFKGYADDRYITQYIVTGLAHLQQLGVTEGAYSISKFEDMLNNALKYTNKRMLEDYEQLSKNKIDKATYVPGNLTLQYLYASSYFKDNLEELSSAQKEARNYFIGQIAKYWTGYSLYEKGLIAIALHRDGDSKTTAAIIKSLKEYSINSNEMGMYWKDNTAGYYWYQAPIETQALMIEVFSEVADDAEATEALKVWLLRQKQTTDWKTTRATAEACYALLLRGVDLLANKEIAMITVGNLLVKPDAVEAGTGYFKTNWLGNDINKNYGKIKIDPPATNSLSYGAMYWQYFEDMDKVTSSNNNLQINKQLFLKQNTNSGPVITPINDNVELHVGDLITVRIEIRSDRDMEYVQMKDMRASGFEPVNVISTYKYQGGLGYYEATGDAATNFFISYLRKGTYVFEYSLRVAHSGNFSNGITTVQCMYAPEFTSHSEGVRVTVK